MVLVSLVDEWNKLARVAVESLNDVKELKKRDIRRLFIFIGKFIISIRDSAIQVKTDLEERIDNLRDAAIAIKIELELKIEELGNRVQELENAKESE